MEAMRAEVKNESPGLSPKELMSRLGAMWNALDEEEKRSYQEASNEDKLRYEQEMEDFKENHPDEYAAMTAKKARKKAGGSDDSPQKRRKKKDKARKVGEDGEEVASQSEAEEEGKHLGWFDKAMHDIKSGVKRRKVAMNEEDKVERAKRLVAKMFHAKQADEARNFQGEPAIMKMQLLAEVESECSKVELKEALLDAGLLKALKGWLEPLPNTAALPNGTLRTALYSLLKKLPIDETRLLNSEGLGKAIMGFWRHKGETKENRHILAGLIQAWARPIHGLSTDYKTLAEVEETRAKEIIARKQALGEHVLPAQKFLKTPRAKIPAPVSFDYAKRPQESFQEEDEEEKKKKQALLGSKARLTKKVLTMRKNVSESKQAAVPNITKMNPT